MRFPAIFGLLLALCLLVTGGPITMAMMSLHLTADAPMQRPMRSAVIRALIATVLLSYLLIMSSMSKVRNEEEIRGDLDRLRRKHERTMHRLGGLKTLRTRSVQ